MNLADELMKSRDFFIFRHHHDASAKTQSLRFLTSFLLADYYQLLASVFQQRCQKNFDSFKKQDTVHSLHFIQDCDSEVSTTQTYQTLTTQTCFTLTTQTLMSRFCFKYQIIVEY